MSDYQLPDGFVYIRSLIPDVREIMAYATDDNFTGARVNGYLAPRAILTRPAARALTMVAMAAGADGYGLAIFDAYRPARAVRRFVQWANDPADTATQAAYYPEFADKAELLRGGFIAERSGHSRGSTVDLTLYRLQDGGLVPMGTGFDRFGPLAAHGAEGITAEETANRAYLCRMMISAGFMPYSAEWWHYTLKNEPYPDTYFDFPVR